MGGRWGGWGRGEGQGAGYRRQYRGGRGASPPGLAGRLRLTQEQSTWIQQQDPNFEEQSGVLRDRLYGVHTDLVASLENARITAQELAAKVDALIEARDTLEKRVARYIVLLRPQLSPEQFDHLAQLCRGPARVAGISGPKGPGPPGDIMAGLSSPQTLADLL